MTLPSRSIKHVKATHRTYQILTILFTVLTLAAALAAAVSGLQLSKLNNLYKKTVEAKIQAPPASSPGGTDLSASQEIEALKSELATEKSASNKLKAKIKDLNNQIVALKKTIIAPKPMQPKPATTEPPKAVVPAKPQNKVTEGKTAVPLPPPPAEKVVTTPTQKTVNELTVPAETEKDTVKIENTDMPKAAPSSSLTPAPQKPDQESTTPTKSPAKAPVGQPVTEQPPPSEKQSMPSSRQSEKTIPAAVPSDQLSPSDQSSAKTVPPASSSQPPEGEKAP